MSESTTQPEGGPFGALTASEIVVFYDSGMTLADFAETLSYNPSFDAQAVRDGVRVASARALEKIHGYAPDTIAQVELAVSMSEDPNIGATLHPDYHPELPWIRAQYYLLANPDLDTKGIAELIDAVARDEVLQQADANQPQQTANPQRKPVFMEAELIDTTQSAFVIPEQLQGVLDIKRENNNKHVVFKPEILNNKAMVRLRKTAGELLQHLNRGIPIINLAKSSNAENELAMAKQRRQDRARELIADMFGQQGLAANPDLLYFLLIDPELPQTDGLGWRMIITKYGISSYTDPVKKTQRSRPDPRATVKTREDFDKLAFGIPHQKDSNSASLERRMRRALTALLG